MLDEMQVLSERLKTVPVDLQGIFSDLGISYREEPLPPSQSGWIERVGDKYTVVVNAWEPAVRQRFTAAHELAHYLLHRDLMQDGSRMNRHTDSLFATTEGGSDTLFKPHHEVQANKMAAQIIMPAAAVRDLHGQDWTAGDIARELDVSKAALEIRLQTLGLT